MLLGLLDLDPGRGFWINFSVAMGCRLGDARPAVSVGRAQLLHWRSKFRLGYAQWQAIHALLAVAIVTTATGHTVLVGYCVPEPWESFLWILSGFAFIGLGVWVRTIKPILRRQRRWIVEGIRPEAGGSTSVSLRLEDPQSYGPDGFNLRAGQFAWILMPSSLA